MEICGFDETLTGPEDWDFDRRIRQVGKVDIIKSVIYHDEVNFSLKRYLDKKIYYMQWFDKYIQKWGRCDPIIKKQLGFWYRYIGVFVEQGKWKRVFRHFILFMGMYMLRVMIGMAYLGKRIRQRNVGV